MAIATEFVGNNLTLKLDGKLVSEQCRQFLKEMDRQLQTDVRALVVDFEKVSYIDGSFMGTLLVMREKANVLGKKISLSNCKGNVKTVLGIAHFHKLFGNPPHF